MESKAFEINIVRSRFESTSKDHDIWTAYLSALPYSVDSLKQYVCFSYGAPYLDSDKFMTAFSVPIILDLIPPHLFKPNEADLAQEFTQAVKHIVDKELASHRFEVAMHINKKEEIMKNDKDWIEDAVSKRGSLRKSLGIKKGKTISEAKLEKAENSKNSLTRKRAVLAETFKKMRRK